MGALEALVDEVFANNPQSIADYKNGKTNAMGFLMGQCMKASKGEGNPSIIKELVAKKLAE